MGQPLHNSPPRLPASSLVVVMPSWLGDGVMATPFLRALRRLYPDARIAAVARPLVAPVLQGLTSINHTQICPKGGEAHISRWLRHERFDLGILLPNSFRSAWMLWRGRVKHRLGYARGGRSWLLTDTLTPRLRTPEGRADDTRKTLAIAAAGGKGRAGSAYQPTPAIAYYLALADHLAGPIPTPLDAPTMELAITDAERIEANQILEIANAHEPVVVMVPGANFGASKCWAPERFAAVADRLSDPAGPFNALIVLANSPSERPIMQAIVAASTRRERFIVLSELNGGRGASLGALKQIVRRSALMLCNDTGPRHFAAALGVPVVTLFGPTDPEWADTFSPHERLVKIDVPCGPCQLKRCPIDHRCMRGITVDMVINAITDLWPRDHLPRIGEPIANILREGEPGAAR